MTSPDAVSIARELGVCEPGKPGSLALLGPGDHAAPYPSCRAKACNHEANRVAYFSSHLFDVASIYRRRAEDHARTATQLDNSRDTRHLHAGGHNEKTQCAGGSGRALVPRKSRVAIDALEIRNQTHCRTKNHKQTGLAIPVCT